MVVLGGFVSGATESVLLVQHDVIVFELSVVRLVVCGWISFVVFTSS